MSVASALLGQLNLQGHVGVTASEYADTRTHEALHAHSSSAAVESLRRGLC